MARRARVDAELVRRGLARSRQQAAELIGAGRVRIDGMPAVKPATAVAASSALTVAGDTERGWVSRGAHKLIGALDAFGIDVAGRRCLDAGASTGGFTEVLLDRGATEVVAVDVGYGQLAWRLREDQRVTVMERVNVRTLSPEALPWQPSLVVADLSQHFAHARRKQVLGRARSLVLADYHNTMLASGDALEVSVCVNDCEWVSG